MDAHQSLGYDRWLRLPPGRDRPVWRRDWQGVLRWPPVRILRVLALGAVAGLAALGAWRGTPALIVVSGAALLVFFSLLLVSPSPARACLSRVSSFTPSLRRA